MHRIKNARYQQINPPNLNLMGLLNNVALGLAAKIIFNKSIDKKRRDNPLIAGTNKSLALRQSQNGLEHN
jgi:hypothetical protein